MEEPVFPRYDFSGIAPRDLRIISLASQGHTNREISLVLSISESLVKKRRSKLLETYKAPSVSSLCVSAALQGLI